MRFLGSCNQLEVGGNILVEEKKKLITVVRLNLYQYSEKM